MAFEFLSNKYFIVVILCVIFFSSVSSLIMLSEKKDATTNDTISTINSCSYVIMGITFLLGALMSYLQYNNITSYDAFEVPVCIGVVGIVVMITSFIQVGYWGQLKFDNIEPTYIVNLVSGIILIAYAVVLYISKKAPAVPEKKPDEKKSGSYLTDLQAAADKAEKIAEENLTKFGSDSSEYIKSNKEANDLNDKLREFEDNLKQIQKRRDQNKKVKELAAGKPVVEKAQNPFGNR